MAIRLFSALPVFVLCLLYVGPADAGTAKSSMAVSVVVMERASGAAIADFLQNAHRHEPSVLLSRAASLPGVVSAELTETPLPERQPDLPSAQSDVPRIYTLTLTY